VSSSQTCEAHGRTRIFHLDANWQRRQLNSTNRTVHDAASRLESLALALAANPDQAQLLFERASLLRKLKKNAQAAADYEHLLRLEPSRFDARANLANTYRDLARYADALLLYDTLLTEYPHVPELHLNKAIAVRKSGDPESALACIERALQLNPHLVLAETEKVNIFRELKRTADALSAIERALSIEPENVQFLNIRGNIYKEVGKVKDALEDYNRALAIEPNFVDALNNRANLFRDSAHFAQALADYDRALEIDAASIEVMINRGNVLRDLYRHPDALAALDAAIRINPDVPQAYLHQGKVLSDLCRPIEAIAAFDHATRLKPDFWEVWFYKGNAHRDLGNHKEALDCFARINQACVDEVNFAAIGTHLFSMNHAVDCSPAEYLQQAKMYGDLVRRLVKEKFTHPNHAAFSGKIKVGLVSGDLQRHPVGYFLKNVLPHIPTDRIELHAFSNCPNEDELTAAIKPCFAQWHLVTHDSDKQLATRIHQSGIHLLIDLAGHTNKSRINVFAWRPAPLQAAWLGYCASTGLEEVDYVMGDHIVTPESDAAYFCEKLWRLPESYFCFDPPAEGAAVSELPALKNGFVTFGSFNKLSKMTSQVVEVWARLLIAVPGSRLMLKSPILHDPETRKITHQRFGVYGIGPERLILEPASDYASYLAAYGKIDVMLDPFPYPGATTTLEGLWMGVPFITMKGDRFLARNGETIAVHAGLAPCIATDADDYVEKAKIFARELPGLAKLRQRLRGQLLQSSLFDGKRFAQQFEQALVSMWMQKVGADKDSVRDAVHHNAR
jgi:predicted O-linked N-acetylglucosamine transferase (SPINDLY family)